MEIIELEAFILHAPVTRGTIADSTHRITHWGMPGVILRTGCGLQGFGFSGTHAHLPSDRLIAACIRDSFGPLLLGCDPREVRSIWEQLQFRPEIQWVGRTGITQLALGAVDIALWDLKAKAAGLPLWKLLGGAAGKSVEMYSTDGGWLNWSLQTLVNDCKRLVEEEGFAAVKVKVGGPDPGEDVRRMEALRSALGPNVRIMADANGRWKLPQALQAMQQLQPLNLCWIEEPLAFDDIRGHQLLAQTIGTPIALGEQLYTAVQFRDFVSAGAVHYVQPDAVRLAGITEWWRVAEFAHCHGLPVVPHVGEMGQVHQHLCLAHPASTQLEYIPWLKPWMRHPVALKDGKLIAPDAPGAGTEPTVEAMEKIRRAIDPAGPRS